MYNNEINISNVFKAKFNSIGIYGKYRFDQQYQSLNTKPQVNIIIEEENSNPDERKRMIVQMDLEQIHELIDFCRYLEETLSKAVNEEYLYNG